MYLSNVFIKNNIGEQIIYENHNIIINEKNI